MNLAKNSCGFFVGWIVVAVTVAGQYPMDAGQCHQGQDGHRRQESSAHASHRTSGDV